MHGDIVRAAKWLGGCLVLSSLIMVIGFHPTVTSRVLTVSRVQPVGEYGPPPFAPPTPAATATSLPVSADVRLPAPAAFFDAAGR